MTASIQIGKWQGTYTFDDKRVNLARGFDHTAFVIEITTLHGNQFTGTVQDDPNTGGMEGIGTITGHVDKDRIQFVKQMPVMTLLMNKQGLRKKLPKKHRPIYYSGTLSEDRSSAEGSWKFKPGIVWMGLFPMPMVTSTGKWSMRLETKSNNQSNTETGN